MEKNFSLFSGLIPCAVYFVLGVLARVKYGKGADRDVLSLLFSVSLIYLTAAVVCFSGDMVESWQRNDYVVLKVYLISSFIPILFLRRLLKDAGMGWIFVSLAIFSAVLLLFMDVSAFMAYPLVPVENLSLFTVVSCMVFFILSFYVYMKRPDFRQTGFYLTVVFALANFIFLFSFHSADGIVGHCIIVALFAAVHIWLSLTALNILRPGLYAGRSGVAGGTGNGRSGLLEEPPVKFYRESDMYNFSDVNMPLKERLIGLFEAEKPFLSKDLTMEEVAMRLFTNKTYLSKTINVEMNKNFRELVNSFRVREAMKIFSQDNRISINELRERCGFNNNASFTSAFKLNTGCTPGEWCRNVKNSVNGKGSTNKS